MTEIKKATSYVELQQIFEEYGGPIYVKPSDGVLSRYSKLKDCIGVIYFIGSSTNIYIDYSICRQYVSSTPKLGEFYPALQSAKWFTSDFTVIYSPKDGEVPEEIIKELDSAYQPGVNKLKGDLVVFHPKILNNPNHILSKYKGFIGVVRPLENKTGGDFMSIFMKPRYSTFGGTLQALTPIEASWIKVNKDDCLVVPPSFSKLIANATGDIKPEDKDSSQNGLVVSSRYEKTPRYNVGDNLAVHWKNKKYDERLVGLCGTVTKVIKAGESISYMVDFNNLVNRQLTLCEGINIGDILVMPIEVEEDSLSDTYAKRGFLIVEMVNLEYNQSIEAYRKVWDMAGKRVVVVNSVGMVAGNPNPPIYARDPFKIGEVKLSPRAIDYNYNAEKLSDALTLCDSIVPAIESHGKNTYIYVYCFEEFSEHEMVINRVLLGKAISKNRNLKKLTKWCENAKNQNLRSALKYLEPQYLGNVYNTLAESQLNDIKFKEV